MLLAMAVTQFTKYLVRDSFPQGTIVNAMVRNLDAFCFMLTGVWLIHMGYFLYILFPEHSSEEIGLHELIWLKKDMKTMHFAEECASLYLGIDMVIVSLAISAIASCSAPLDATEAYSVVDGK